MSALVFPFLPLAFRTESSEEMPSERGRCFDVSQLMNTKLQVSVGWRVMHHMALLIHPFK